LFEEYDIKCEADKKTYKINNYQTKKYFQLIKNKFIREFDLYEGVMKLSYETNTEYDFLFNKR
jgi:hypothetical protein